MIKNPPIQRRASLRTTLLIGLAGCLIVGTTARSQDTNAQTRLKPTVVPGSLIPTAETVGPAPVETINAAEIEKTGATDVLGLVKRLSPSFSGNANVGQTVNNGGFGEANVALRNLPTLV